MSRGRLYCFTDFIRKISFYEGLTYSYIIIGEETCPETKKVHWQGFIHFANARSFSSVQKEFHPRHIELCKGSVKQNITYCSKDNNIILEDGECPNQGKRSDLVEVCDKIKEGIPLAQIIGENTPVCVKYLKNLKEIHEILNPQPKRNWKTKVIVLWGEAETGKTRTAIEAGAVSIKWTGQFMNNYNNQDIVLWDDFDCTRMDRDLFCELTDRYPATINVKYGIKEWNPKTIYITSNFDPSLWYGGGKAISRRLDEVIKVTQK